MMKIHVSRDDAHEFNVHEFTAFASDLGITAAFIAQHGWPKRLTTDLGNRLPFIAIRQKVNDGDLEYVRYSQANGCISLKVFND